MKNTKIATIVLLLMMSIPMLSARADIDITVITDGDVDLDLSSEEGMLSIDYNGRDLLKEIQQKIKAIEGLRTIIAYYAARTDVEDLQAEIDELDENVQTLVEELNMVLADLYSKVNSQAHIIGINPANNSVAQVLIAGNSTVSDYLSTTLKDIDVIHIQLTSIQQQMDGRYTETTTTLQSLADNLDTALTDLWATDNELDNRAEILSMNTEELQTNLFSLTRDFELLKDSSKNISIIFGVFSMIAIAIVAMTRKP